MATNWAVPDGCGPVRVIRGPTDREITTPHEFLHFVVPGNPTYDPRGTPQGTGEATVRKLKEVDTGRLAELVVAEGSQPVHEAGCLQGEHGISAISRLLSTNYKRVERSRGE